MNRYFYLSHIFCRMYPFPLIISRPADIVTVSFPPIPVFCMGIVRYPVHDIFSARDLSAVIHRKTLSSRFHGRYQILYPYRFPSDRQPLHHGRENLPVSSRNMEMDIFVSAVHHHLEPPCTLRRQNRLYIPAPLAQVFSYITWLSAISLSPFPKRHPPRRQSSR